MGTENFYHVEEHAAVQLYFGERVKITRFEGEGFLQWKNAFGMWGTGLVRKRRLCQHGGWCRTHAPGSLTLAAKMLQLAASKGNRAWTPQRRAAAAGRQRPPVF